MDFQQQATCAYFADNNEIFTIFLEFLKMLFFMVQIFLKSSDFQKFYNLISL